MGAGASSVYHAARVHALEAAVFLRLEIGGFDAEVFGGEMRGEPGAVCLLVCDLLGMSRSFSRPVREAVATVLGLDVAAVLTSCVHTHAGPSTIGLAWTAPGDDGTTSTAAFFSLRCPSRPTSGLTGGASNARSHRGKAL